ncbi:hypothetical protein T552_01665 [Pneumocystis carinii B80]|uniref:Nucleoporin Nup82 n=1 Tax=Pneumocystis carinii (strain B80) TaxID=1408658 RepID=A0A0W4ZJ51_PNEC8|nr:hypothetical protein T552_01665 [Pneumocystis carinii B80]KTW28403.1 hypothetical protein T552_01665 [Pneumocystis carinii B80]
MDDIYGYIFEENKWVHFLENHPIFSVSEKEQELIGNMKNRRSLIAVRQTEVFVAVDRTIRYADLKDCKIEENQKDMRMEYKEFKLKKISFHIERLIINMCGTILVVVGSHDLATIFLPTYLNSLEENSLRDIFVGRKYYSQIEIVSVLFHPASKNFSTILVLSSDAVIRVFELSLSFEESEQSIDLISGTGRTRKKGSFIVDEDVFQVSDFCFDSKANEWSLFTLYVLLQNGDIYSICPLVPTNCMVQRSYLNRLACYISTKSQQLEKSKDSTSSISLENESIRMQTRWISDILGQVSLINDYGLGSPLSQNLDMQDLVTFRRPNISKFPVLIQGPFLFQPAPLEFSSQHVTASNIITLGTNVVGILIISYADGKIDVCVEVERVEPKWVLSKDEEFPPPVNYLATYETITVLDSKNACDSRENVALNTFLIQDVTKTNTFYFYYKTCIYSVVLGWLEKLEKNDNIEVTSIAFLLSEGIQHSSISKLIDMNSLSYSSPTIIGCDFLTHAYFGHSLIFWSTAFNCTLIELDITNQIQLGNALEESNSKDTSVSGKNDHLKYFSLLTLPVYLVSMESLNFLKEVPSFIIPDEFQNKLVVSQEFLRFLGKVTLETRKNTEKLHNLVVSMYRRLELQGREFMRQLEKLYVLKNKVDSIVSKNSSERLKDAINNQKNLQKRADQILQKLIKSHSPTLSDNEKKWFDELKRIKMKTYGSRGFNEKILSLSKQFEAIKLERAHNKPAIDLSSKDKLHEPVTMSQINQIRLILDEQEQHISQTKSKLKKLSNILGAKSEIMEIF